VGSMRKIVGNKWRERRGRRKGVGLLTKCSLN